MATHLRQSASSRGYDARWRKARALYLQDNPLCCMCHREGRITAAMVVDHIKAHKGDAVLFWDRANWQALCAPHHNSTKQSEERLGYAKGVDEAGMPIDPSHPWNTQPSR